jgi:hypothetical protein
MASIPTRADQAVHHRVLIITDMPRLRYELCFCSRQPYQATHRRAFPRKIDLGQTSGRITASHDGV